MIDLTNIDHVQALQATLRVTLDTPQGVELITFLEQVCGWYDFNETDPNKILIAHGKRQVLATIKTLMRLPAEQIIAMANQLEES